MKLLIVDDSVFVRRSIERTVRKEEWEIRMAPDGVEALKIFGSFQPELVTMDITMPKLDGLSCLHRMLDLRPETKILVISALADKPTAVQAITLGAQSFLLKPFTEEQLEEEIHELFAAEMEPALR